MNLNTRISAAIDAFTVSGNNTINEPINIPYQTLLFLETGTGTLTRNNITVTLTAPGIVFLNKNDQVTLRLTPESHAYVCRVTEDTKMELKRLIEISNGKATPPIRAKSVMHPFIALAEKDAHLMKHYYNLLVALQDNAFSNLNLIYYQVLCILMLVERNIAIRPGTTEKGIPEPNIRPIIRYIQKNLRTPEMLKLSTIAETFNLTYNKLCAYFKQEMNTTVKQYILQCRMQAIEKRVQQPTLSFSEIANEFGFVDESHFYKNFKSYYKVSPSAYRKQLKE
ncbi:helix-turn-helix domain-containing protein [Neptunitalea lumnitzerae]|uniref:HTH araC/xylS-type domain-containing protein n=1 Tax=Neptunitalea lumnitzerae TaxID=2965509 RepID=A0ABQ5MH65_9FLAO|nr:AraC family transcriptional regulator [Neptunitalea sp. Y10]GLB48758.1 hypothetical protein Y10_11260 [Neptunitalea sp. Y10]